MSQEKDRIRSLYLHYPSKEHNRPDQLPLSLSIQGDSLVFTIDKGDMNPALPSEEESVALNNLKNFFARNGCIIKSDIRKHDGVILHLGFRIMVEQRTQEEPS